MLRVCSGVSDRDRALERHHRKHEAPSGVFGAGADPPKNPPTGHAPDFSSFFGPPAGKKQGPWAARFSTRAGSNLPELARHREEPSVYRTNASGDVSQDVGELHLEVEGLGEPLTSPGDDAQVRAA